MADEPRQWLERMSHAHREMSYQGVVSYQVDDHLSSFRLLHSVANGREFEELQPLDSDSRQLVHRGHSVDCVHAAETLLRNSAAEGRLVSYYELSMGKPGRVAGRDVVILNIVPRDVFRLAYRLALDEKTAIPLKTETLDRSGRVLERFQFMVFELGAPADDSLYESVESRHHGEPLSPLENETLLAEMPWQPHWVPDGFTLAQTHETPGETLSYTDGISVFSVFVEPRAAFGDKPVATAMRRGATVSYSYPIPGHDAVATVMGEVPLLTAEQVAKSVTVKP